MNRPRAASINRFLVSIAGLLALAGSSVARGGDLLVGDVASNTIKRFDATTGAPVGVDGTFASGGGLSTPFGLAYGPDGNLYVSSLGTGNVLEYNGTTGAFLQTFIAKGQGGLNFPNQIAFGPDGNLYVSSYNYNTSTPSAVLEYAGPTSAAAGTFLRSFTDPRLLGATGLAFGTTGGTTNAQLYVASSIDTGSPTPHSSIFRFNTGLSGSETSGSLFSVDPNLHATAGLSIDPNGNVVAANFNGNNSSITRYNPNTGQNIDGGPFIAPLPNLLNINGPAEAIFGSDGKMYVSSYSRNSIYRFDAATGAFDTTFVGKTSALNQPLYMTFMPSTPNPQSSFVTAVPEPASLALLGLGLTGYVVYRRRTAQVTA